MSRHDRLDVVVVGGGVVGASAALALAARGLEVALVEAGEPSRWQADRPDLRVYAFAPDNAALLDGLGVWPRIVAARAQSYRRMQVWDAGGGGVLTFDADLLGRSELGWIVEHGLLVDRLWAALPSAGVRVHCPVRVVALQQDDTGVRLQLDDGSHVDARVAIAADGAQSTLRALAGIDVDGSDYGQRGLVAYVRTSSPHGATAWQRFLPGGPVALLPCPDRKDHTGPRGCIGSIVWTLPDPEAARMLALDDGAFGEAVARALDGRLGSASLLSPRVAFPLRRQLAREYVQGRVLVLGDAAHVVHPLAGQGVNLGLRDVAALRDMVLAAQAARGDWTAPHRLVRWGRARKSENAVAAHAFDRINRVFTSDGVASTLLRGPLLGLAGSIPELAHAFWRRASGA